MCIITYNKNNKDIILIVFYHNTCFLFLLCFWKINFFKNRCVLLLYLYIMVMFIFYNFGFTYVNISYYYQILTFLNNKSNVICIIILSLLCSLIKVFTTDKFIKIALNGCFFLTLIFFTNIFNSFSTLLFFWVPRSLVNLNNNLLNGLMLIHPLLLYTSYSTIFILFVYLFFFKKNIEILRVQTYTKARFFLKKNILILFAFLLGCWWAEQELSWGGWWNWDFVELLAFVYWLILLTGSHFKLNIRILLTISIFILLIILSVRFNIINSVHNFINLESQNQFYFYISLVVLTLLVFFFKNYTNIFFKNIPLGVIFAFCILYFILVYILFLLKAFNNFSLNQIPTSIFLFAPTYITILLLVINLYGFIKFSVENSLLFYIWVPLHFFLNISYFTYLDTSIFVLLTAIILIKNNFFCGRYLRKVLYCIHFAFLYYSYVIFHQNYTFGLEYNLFWQVKLFLIKVSQLYGASGFIFKIPIESNLIYSNNTSIIFSNFILPNNSTNISTSIFGKQLWVSSLYLYELYNYNLQNLLQQKGLCLVLIPTIIITFNCVLILYKTKLFNHLSI